MNLLKNNFVGYNMSDIINKKDKKFIASLSYLKIRLNAVKTKLFDEITSLYFQKKIKNKSQVEKLLRKISFGRGKVVQSMESIIKKYNPIKTFHFGVVINHEAKYRQKDGTYKDSLIEGKRNYTVQALDENIAKQIVTDEIYNDYNYEESLIIRDVKDIIFTSIIDEYDLKPLKTREGFLTKASYPKYNDLNNCEKYDKKEGFCTFDNFVGIYSKYFNITKEKLIKKCKEFYDYKSITINDKKIKNWVPEYGTTPEFWNEYCIKKDISHYCFDITRTLVLKHISKNNNYPPLIYFAMNDHMYLIKDKNLCKSLCEKAKDKKVNENFTSNMLETEEKKNIYLDCNILADIPMQDILKYDSSIIIYSEVNDLTNLFIKSFELYNIIPSDVKATRDNIKQFSLTLNEKNYIFCLDPNAKESGINWKIVKSYCEKYKIEFKNQTLTTFFKQLREMFFLNKRTKISQKTKDNLIKKYNDKCAICKLKKENYEIDHIQPLSNNGSNDFDNLQLLCQSCHKEKCKHEQEDGDYMKISMTESSFNNETNKIITSEHAQNYAFIEHMKSLTEPKNEIFHIDINKCRKNLLRYSNFDYCLFTCMDAPKIYTGEKKNGLYFIQSYNYIPLRGSGWYYLPMVLYCLEKKIITEENILFVVESSINIPKDYYNDFIDYVYNEFDNKTAKLAINSMIGAFKLNCVRNQTSNLICTSTNSSEAFNIYLEKNCSFIGKHDVNNNPLYLVYKNQYNTKLETESPIYNQIVQLENIEIHKLTTLITNRRGTVLDISTDKVICTFTDNILPFELDENQNIKNFYFDNEKTVLKYKLENGKDRLRIESKPKYIRYGMYYLPKYEWNLYNDMETNDFTPLINTILDKNQSFHIDGKAGTGKTFLIKQLQTEMKKRELAFLSLAPTNKACRLIDGKTLHKFILKFKSLKNIQNLNYDYIFIDEISMMKEIFYMYLLAIKKINPNIKIILTGDFRQLEPVNDRVNVNYKDSIALYDLCDGNRLQLETCRRSDDKLYNICDNIESITSSTFSNNFTFKHICYTHKKRIEINDIIMKQKLKSKVRHGDHNYIELKKNIYDSHSQDVVLYNKMPIIAHVNNKDKNIFNNETFTIIKCSVDAILIKSDNGNGEKIVIRKEDFQKYFYPAYALTAHCTQGSTFTENYTIHEWYKMSNKMKYVCLSRAKEFNQINIIF